MPHALTIPEAKRLAAAVANWDPDAGGTVFSEADHQTFLATLATGDQEQIKPVLTANPVDLDVDNAARVARICVLIEGTLGRGAFDRSNANIVAGIEAHQTTKSTHWY